MSGATLVNVDNTISGQGSIGLNTLAITNQALIRANVTGATLSIDPSAGGVTNSGSMLATNGATLRLFNDVFTNTGTFIADNGSTLSLSGATISGGLTSQASIREPGSEVNAIVLFTAGDGARQILTGIFSDQSLRCQ